MTTAGVKDGWKNKPKSTGRSLLVKMAPVGAACLYSPGGVSRAGQYLVVVQETAAGQIT